MKLELTEATVTAITPIGENHGEEVVLAKAIKIEASVPPRVLDTFTPKIRKLLFDNDIPTIPELGTIGWKVEYEKARVTFALAGAEVELLAFTKAEIKKIKFAPREGFLFDLTLSIKVIPTEEQAGALDFLLKKQVDVVIEKATQKTVEEVIGETTEDSAGAPGDDKQGSLKITPLIPDTTAAVQAANDGDATAAAALEAIDRAEAT